MKHDRPCQCGVHHRRGHEAHAIQLFSLGESFQADFDRWKAEVEAREKGTLVIVDEVPVVQNGTATGLLIFWRIQLHPVRIRRKSHGRAV